MSRTRWMLWMGALALLWMGFASEAMASAATVRSPEVVDGACKKITAETHPPRIYVSGRVEAMSSPPGGPVNHMVFPLEQAWLSVRRVGCQHLEPLEFVRDGKCEGLPRYRWKGNVRKGQAFEVLYGGHPLLKIGQQDPNAAPQCPGPPPALYDETKVKKGFPKKVPITVKTADIRTWAQNGGLQVSVPLQPLKKHLMWPHIQDASRHVAKKTREDFLGDAKEQTLEVTITVRVRRFEQGQPGAIQCKEEHFETVWVELPGGAGHWQIESKVPDNNLVGTPGRCKRLE